MWLLEAKLKRTKTREKIYEEKVRKKHTRVNGETKFYKVTMEISQDLALTLLKSDGRESQVTPYTPLFHNVTFCWKKLVFSSLNNLLSFDAL